MTQYPQKTDDPAHSTPLPAEPTSSIPPGLKTFGQILMRFFIYPLAVIGAIVVVLLLLLFLSNLH